MQWLDHNPGFLPTPELLTDVSPPLELVGFQLSDRPHPAGQPFKSLDEALLFIGLSTDGPVKLEILCRRVGWPRTLWFRGATTPALCRAGEARPFLIREILARAHYMLNKDTHAT